MIEMRIDGKKRRAGHTLMHVRRLRRTGVEERWRKGLRKPLIEGLMLLLKELHLFLLSLLLLVLSLQDISHCLFLLQWTLWNFSCQFDSLSFRFCLGNSSCMGCKRSSESLPRELCQFSDGLLVGTRSRRDITVGIGGSTKGTRIVDVVGVVSGRNGLRGSGRLGGGLRRRLRRLLRGIRVGLVRLECVVLIRGWFGRGLIVVGGFLMLLIGLLVVAVVMRVILVVVMMIVVVVV